jgi:hypothetical protein
MAGGMLWAAIPAFLRTRYNANEILVSLMLVYVASFVLSLLVHDAWRDPEGFNFPQSKMFTESALAAEPAAETRLNVGLLHGTGRRRARLAVHAQEPRRLPDARRGLAPAAANYAGISSSRNVWLGMLIGGACAGLAGVGEVAGPIGQLLPIISPGYGFAAIIVAFVGRLHPIGIFFASLLMSLLYLGGEAAQMRLALPSSVTGLFQGTLLFFPARRRRLHPLSACASCAPFRWPRRPRDGSRRAARRPHARRRHAARLSGARRARHRKSGGSESRRRRHDAGRRRGRLHRRGQFQVAVARFGRRACAPGARCR